MSTVRPASRTPKAELLESLLRRRILFLDGAMGTMLQNYRLTEVDYRGDRWRDHPKPLAGNHDVLAVTRPHVVREVHEAFLEAGADIIETNTFSSTSVAQADYGLEGAIAELNLAAARVAREAADAWTARTPDKPRFVAGSIGPTNRTLSLSPKVEDPGYRAITFDAMRQAYFEQAKALVEGGVDVLLAETVIDTLNLKACIVAMQEAFDTTGIELPIMLSVTITDRSGRTLSGQTIEAFWISVAHARPLTVGVNCALGAADMRPYVASLSEIAPAYITCYPNAGLPNAFGEYDEQPPTTAGLLQEFARSGLLNVVGGCCGTTPEHVRAIVEAIEPIAPRKLPSDRGRGISRFAGLEPLEIRPPASGVIRAEHFVMIGERTNVTGSRKFANLIKADNYDAALEVALQQVRNGANIIDINMDEGMLDSEQAMETFLRLLASEPEISRVPIMLDSSRWSVLERGLQWVQGKGIVNSISLKEGEADFLDKARHIQRFGAGAVVMAFDERGQADTVERKVEICERAYRLLTETLDWNPSDIVFDPNVLAIGTGLEEHADYAVAFIEATRIIKERCPGVRVSGGISNLSFSFRGNDAVREAMHSVFLYHAIRAGLDMGIVNAGQLVVYEDIEPELLRHVDDEIARLGEQVAVEHVRRVGAAACLTERARVGIEREEVVGAPQWQQELAHSGTNALFGHDEIAAANDRTRHQEPAHGVGAVALEHLAHIGVIAQALRHLLSVVAEHDAVTDDARERRAVEERRREHMHRVEPTARLPDVLDDEVGGVVRVEPVGVLEGVVHLREGHRA